MSGSFDWSVGSRFDPTSDLMADRFGSGIGQRRMIGKMVRLGFDRWKIF
jgi:hypothetical protein